MAVTVELERPPVSADEFSRADLEFRGIDHSGPSYEARVFLNNRRADASTPRDEGAGYAGSFVIFGHGGCFGELGHCDVRSAPASVYDLRPPHPLNPQFRTVVITEALRRVLRSSRAKTLTVTVVAAAPENATSRLKVDDPLKFESVSLMTYQDASAAGIPLPPLPS
jgi:hypothetical protein